MAKKFIINNGDLIMGHVEFHKELCSDHTETKGGGWFYADNENKKIYLYSSSLEFGKSTKENIEAALKKGRLPIRLKKDYEFYYSDSEKLDEAISNGILLTK